MNNKKIIIFLFSLLCILFCFLSNVQAKPTSPIHVNLSVDGIPSLNQNVGIVSTITTTYPASNTTATIYLPDGFELVDGNISWSGKVMRDEPVQFDLTVKAVKEGNWTVKAKARKSGKEHTGGGFDYIYISILKDKGIIYLDDIITPFIPKINKTDRQILTKLNNSEIPQNNLTPSKSIITPKPTILPSPTSPMKIEMSFSNAPALNQNANITTTITYIGRQIKNMSDDTIAQIILPDGFKVIDGNLSWSGKVMKDEPVQFDLTVKAVKTGNWTVEANVRSPPTGREHIGGRDWIYVSVFEDKGIISEKPFPLPKREGSDMGTKLNNSEISSIKEGIPDKNIVTPEPSYD